MKKMLALPGRAVRSNDFSRLSQPLLIIWLALLFRLAYLSTASQSELLLTIDANRYHWMAVNLLSQGVFSTETGPPYYPNHVWSPLYPLFLAAIYFFTGSLPQLVVFIQAVLDSVTVAVTYRLGQQLSGRRVGLTAALAYAATPAAWRFCNDLLTEILFGLLLTLSCWLLARYVLKHRTYDMLLFGIFAGAAILCKPNIQFVPILLMVVLIYKWLTGQRSWWQGSMIALLTILLILLPWGVRNRLVFGKWFYTTTFEYNLSLVSAVATLTHARGESVAPWTPRWWATYDEIYQQAKERSLEKACDPFHAVCQRDIHLRYLTSTAIEVIQVHPLDFIMSHIEGWLRSFIPQEHRFWYEWLAGQPWAALPQEGDALGRALDLVKQGHLLGALQVLIRERVLALPPLALALWVGWAVAYFVTAAFFFIGVVNLRPRVLSLIFIVTVFYLTFLPGPISHIRFRLPVVPLILLTAVIGMFSLYKANAVQAVEKNK